MLGIKHISYFVWNTDPNLNPSLGQILAGLGSWDEAHKSRPPLKQFLNSFSVKSKCSAAPHTHTPRTHGYATHVYATPGQCWVPLQYTWIQESDTSVFPMPMFSGLRVQFWLRFEVRVRTDSQESSLRIAAETYQQEMVQTKLYWNTIMTKQCTRGWGKRMRGGILLAGLGKNAQSP